MLNYEEEYKNVVILYPVPLVEIDAVKLRSHIPGVPAAFDAESPK